MFDGEWHHAAATYDGKIKVVYLDGVAVGNIAATGKIETSTGRLLLGAGRDTSPPTLFLAGRIDEGSRIYETWIDGWTNGTGSTFGYIQAPFAERTVVHGGLQSIPLDYNNVVSPFYSEADREFATAQDWTVGDVGTLVLFVRGKLGNREAPLYVVLKDASNRSGAVTYPDSAVVGTTKWTEWKIPLSSFAGLNMAKVKKISIGLGNKAHPAAGGAGVIFVDDLRLIEP